MAMLMAVAKHGQGHYHSGFHISGLATCHFRDAYDTPISLLYNDFIIVSSLSTVVFPKTREHSCPKSRQMPLRPLTQNTPISLEARKFGQNNRKPRDQPCQPRKSILLQHVTPRSAQMGSFEIGTAITTIVSLLLSYQLRRVPVHFGSWHFKTSESE